MIVQINFGVPETGIVMQYGCNMCKSLAHSVSVTLDEVMLELFWGKFPTCTFNIATTIEYYNTSLW